MRHDSATRDGLRFFGRVSASVSHEIKNVFAVINEAAGLIGDFTLMAEKGVPLQPERLRKAANSIQGQIRRGDAIVRNMNAFAHSVDEDVCEVALPDLVELTVALATRMADMLRVGLTLDACEPAVLKANPFDLMRLLHAAITAAVESLSAGDTLAVGVHPAPGGACFTLRAGGKAIPRVDADALVATARDMDLTAEVGETDGALTLRVTAPQAG